MKQTEMFRKAKAKARFCNWLIDDEWKTCGKSAIIQIKDAAYCSDHAELAQKYFGTGTPICQ